MKKLNQLLFIFSLSLLSLFFVSCHKNQVSENQAYPQRIISLSPAATEILYAIGAESQIAATDEFSDYPEAAKALPKAGGFDGKTLSIEKLLTFNPDFVYITEGMHNFLIQKLDDLGIRYYISNSSSFDDVKKEILEIGAITGHEEKANSLVKEFDDSLNSIPCRAMQFFVYYEVWNAPYMSCGKTSFINDVIAYSGAENIFDDLSEAYPMVSEETIISRMPDIILLPASSGASAEDVEKRAGWDVIPAVKNKSIYIIDDNLFSRPGPRVINAVRELNEIVNSQKAF